jgi:hypothetical protein
MAKKKKGSLTGRRTAKMIDYLVKKCGLRQSVILEDAGLNRMHLLRFRRGLDSPTVEQEQALARCIDGKITAIQKAVA